MQSECSFVYIIEKGLSSVYFIPRPGPSVDHTVVAHDRILPRVVVLLGRGIARRGIQVDQEARRMGLAEGSLELIVSQRLADGDRLLVGTHVHDKSRSLLTGPGSA